MNTDITTFSHGVAYIDGEIVPISEAKISLLDWGFLHSDATYDVAHVWQGRFFRLDDHLERFFSSMRKLRMSIPHSRNELQSILVDCVRACGLREAYVEMICTRGMPETGSRDPRTCKNRFFAFAIPFVWVANPEKQKQGLHLIVSNHQRIAPESVDPTVKNYHWLDMVMGLFEAYDLGGETVVVVDKRGNIVEGPGFNFSAIKDRTIMTPASGILEGITRKTAMELATGCGYEAVESNIPADNARTADEVFITTTAGGIIPITKVDGKAIGSGTSGPITEELQAAYWKLHDNPKYALKIDY